MFWPQRPLVPNSSVGNVKIRFTFPPARRNDYGLGSRLFLSSNSPCAAGLFRPHNVEFSRRPFLRQLLWHAVGSPLLYVMGPLVSPFWTNISVTTGCPGCRRFFDQKYPVV